jgi:hypothetical protein
MYVKDEQAIAKIASDLKEQFPNISEDVCASAAKNTHYQQYRNSRQYDHTSVTILRPGDMDYSYSQDMVKVAFRTDLSEHSGTFLRLTIPELEELLHQIGCCLENLEAEEVESTEL